MPRRAASGVAPHARRAPTRRNRTASSSDHTARNDRLGKQLLCNLLRGGGCDRRRGHDRIEWYCARHRRAAHSARYRRYRLATPPPTLARCRCRCCHPNSNRCGDAELRMRAHAHAATICKSGCLGALADLLNTTALQLPSRPYLAVAARSARALDAESCAIVGLTLDRCFAPDAVQCKLACTHCARFPEQQEWCPLPAAPPLPRPVRPRPFASRACLRTYPLCFLLRERPISHAPPGHSCIPSATRSAVRMTTARSASRSSLPCAACGAACTGLEPCAANGGADVCATPLAVECLAECTVCVPPERCPFCRCTHGYSEPQLIASRDSVAFGSPVHCVLTGLAMQS